MGKKYIIVIDAGSSNIKTAFYDTDGECMVTYSEKAPRESSNPGLSKAQAYYDVTIHCLKTCVEKADIDKTLIEAIVFTGQMAGTVGVDKNWNAVTFWSGTMHTDHIPYFMKMPDTYQNNLLKYSGTNASFMFPKIKWIQDVYANQFDSIKKFLIIGNYVAGKMAGIDIEDAFIDRTLLEWTGGADIKNDCWSPLLCQAAEVDMQKLPRIVNSSDVIGRLGRETAQICDLPSGIPLVAGAGDKPAGCIGAGIVNPGQLIDETSTVGAISQCLDEFIPDTRHRMLETIPSPIPGQYYASVYFVGSGATIEWYIENICPGEEAKKAGQTVYSYMNDHASKLPAGSDGLLAIGMLNGRALPMDPDIRGLWIGHSWNHRPEHFYRALLESIGYEYACALKVMQETYPHLKTDELRVIGGGANSMLYNQIKADILGKTYSVLKRDDTTMLGAAIIGGHAVGLFDDIRRTAEGFVNVIKKIEPIKKNYSIYRKYIELYESSFDTLRHVYEELKCLRTLS